MNYRDLARTKLDSLIEVSNRQSKSPSQLDPLDKVIKSLIEELNRPELIPLLEFVSEYHGAVETFFGCFYDPYPGTEDLKPFIQKSKNPKSPYYCLKIPIKKMGNAYLVPLGADSIVEFVLILKPERPYRLPVSVGKTTIQQVNVAIFYPPYLNLMTMLTSWAVSREISLRKIS